MLPRTTYRFRFIAALPPSAATQLYVKQLYLLLLWVYYMFEQWAAAPAYCFFVYPRIRQIYTFFKAPMAHKTYSKEQFYLQYYQFQLVVQAPTVAIAALPTYTKFAAYRTRAVVPETNLIILSQTGVGAPYYPLLG